MKQLTIEEANEMILPGKTTEEYQRSYDYIIDLAEPRGLDKSKIDFYCETHHVLCKCLGGGDEPENLRNLSYLEHIVCHILLYRIFPTEIKLVYPALSMACGWTNSSLGTLKKEFEDILSKLDFSKLNDIREAAINSLSVPVVCYDEDNNVIRIFKSGKEANRQCDIYPGRLPRVIREKKKLGKYFWNYLEEFEKLYPEKVEEFLNTPEDKLPICHKVERIFTINRSRIICYSSYSNRIFKIYNNINEVEEDGFDKSIIIHSLTRVNWYHKEGKSVNQGYRWEYEDRWEFPEEIEKYLSRADKVIPIPFNSKGDVLKISEDNTVLEIFKSPTETGRKYKGYNLVDNIPKQDGILELPVGRFIKLKDYIRLFEEDRWLDYLRHKQQSNNDERNTNPGR